MKTILLSAFLFLSVAGCKKDEVGKAVLTGKYDGTFQRIPGTGNKQIAAVSIEFTNTTFSGTSDQPKYPAICNGTYTTQDSAIHFVNGCAWTADFDGTLILNGKYQYTVKGDSLQIHRNYGGQISDIYKLKRR